MAPGSCPNREYNLKAHRSAYAGIDLACAKRKPLPLVVAVWQEDVFEPLNLREFGHEPPRGRGNLATIDARIVSEFARESRNYLLAIQSHFKVSIEQIGIDAPQMPKRAGQVSRDCEEHLGRENIRYFSTPNAREFEAIKSKARAHMKSDGREAYLPSANKLWMLVGFELFAELGKTWDCLEVYPQATAVALNCAAIHKGKTIGLLNQLSAAKELTNWPNTVEVESLRHCGYGKPHDILDAYLAAYVASLAAKDRRAIGTTPHDAIWVPQLRN